MAFGEVEKSPPCVLRDPVEVLADVGVDARLARLAAAHAERHDADVTPAAVAHLQQQRPARVALWQTKTAERVEGLLRTECQRACGMTVVAYLARVPSALLSASADLRVQDGLVELALAVLLAPDGDGHLHEHVAGRPAVVDRAPACGRHAPIESDRTEPGGAGSIRHP